MGNPNRRIYRDVSDPSILVKCSDCPWWFAIRLDLVRVDLVPFADLVRLDDVEPARAEHARIQYEKRQRHAVSA